MHTGTAYAETCAASRLPFRLGGEGPGAGLTRATKTFPRFYNIPSPRPSCPNITHHNLELELANDRQRERTITDWFGQYSRRVLAFVRSKINDFEAAEDAAQDVWLQLTRQPDLEDIEQVGNWLFTAARNRVTDYYRKKRPVPFSQIATENADNESFDDEGLADDLFADHWLDDNLPDTLLESQEFWEELDRVLATLPAAQREVFVAHELEEVPFREMAERTGIPINTLLARKRYAVLRLREHFQY